MMLEVAKREIATRGRSKAYRVSTGILVVITIAFVIGAAIFGSRDDSPGTVEVTIGITSSVERLDDTLEALAPPRVETETLLVADDEVEQLLLDGDVDVVIRDGTTLVWNDEPDQFVQSIVVEALTDIAVVDRAGDLGLDDATLDELLAPIPLESEFIDPPTDGDNAKTVVATIGIFIMFFSIQMYGSQIALVVVEEKAHRIVEILLALVRPRDLLAGKVIGVGVLAAVQVVIPIIGLFLALALSGSVGIPASAYASLPLLFVTFLLGFTMYGTLFAVVGSLVSRQEDAQQALFPVFVPIITGYVLALQAVAAPDSVVAKVASIVPFTSPFALPVTTAEGTASIGVVAIALVLLAATTVFLLGLAGRIYEFTLLRSGSRITLGEALRLSRR
ncbi:ABC transporter permease [Ilumatobacter coccineus]|nr:ABC transporter permease [Ilumatobacter coccineus]